MYTCVYIDILSMVGYIEKRSYLFYCAVVSCNISSTYGRACVRTCVRERARAATVRKDGYTVGVYSFQYVYFNYCLHTAGQCATVVQCACAEASCGRHIVLYLRTIRITFS